MKKIIFILTIAVLTMVISAQAFDLGPLKFSDLFSNTDAVIAAKIIDVDNQKNAYVMTLQVDETMYGTLGEKNITVSSPKTNGYFMEDDSYLEKDKEYILFLKQSNSEWKFAGYSADFDKSLKDDFKQIINKYTGNKNIFSKNNSNSLIGLYNSTKNNGLKNIILNDLEETLAGTDIGFLNSMTSSINKREKIFGISMAGKLKIAGKRQNIESVLSTETDEELRFYSIISLGDMGNNDSAELIKPFLISEIQVLRRVAIEALGKINDSSNLSSLTSIYAGELDMGNRIAIIDAIANLSNKPDVVAAYKNFKKSEPEKFIRHYLDDQIAKIDK